MRNLIWLAAGSLVVMMTTGCGEALTAPTTAEPEVVKDAPQPNIVWGS